MLCFDEGENGRLSLCRLLRRMKGGEPDVLPSEVVVGAAFDGIDGISDIKQAGARVEDGIKAAITALIEMAKPQLA